MIIIFCVIASPPAVGQVCVILKINGLLITDTILKLVSVY